MSFALAQYRNVRVETATPIQIVVDLYRGALRALRHAQALDREGRRGVRGLAISRAHAIVSELQATLDHAQAPELCGELHRLYDFVIHQIMESNLQSDMSKLDGAIAVLERLEGAWAELAGRP